MNQKRNLDGNRHHARSSSKASKEDANKKIRKKSCKNIGRCTIKTRRNTFAGTAKKKFVAASYKGSIFVGTDLHKTFLLVAAVDDKDNLLMNTRIENRYEDIKHHFEMMLANAIRNQVLLYVVRCVPVSNR